MVDSVILLFRLRATPPPALLASLKYAYSPCVLSSVFSLTFSVMLIYYYFSSLPSIFRFRFGHRLFHPVFVLWVLRCLRGFGFCCDWFSMRRIICMYRDPYVRWSHLFVSVWGVRFVSVADVCIIFRFCFSPQKVIFRSKAIWACPVTKDSIICSDELIREQTFHCLYASLSEHPKHPTAFFLFIMTFTFQLKL